MKTSSDIQKNIYKKWVTENLGEKTGIWYSPYLEKLGLLLNKYGLGSGYKENFFDYQSYQEFKEVYQNITKQNSEDIEKLLLGKSVPRYPEKFGTTRIQFRTKYAEDEFNRGLRSKPDNIGGIPDWGVLMRSYLIFLYYNENPTLIYPKKEKKIASNEDVVDSSINYWVIAPGESSKLWDEFKQNSYIAIGWDFLGDLKDYSSKEEIERMIAKQRLDSARPLNDTKTVWDFGYEIKVGDVVYVKEGIKKILARGVVTSDYFYDEKALVYKHRRRVEWLQIGKWELHNTLAQKTLTCLNRYPLFIQEIDQVMSEDFIDPKVAEINEFKSWLSAQITDTGANLSDTTINQKINSLKNIEQHFKISIFGEVDTEQLKQLKELIVSDKSYHQYKGVSGSSIDYYIRFVKSKPVIQENELFTQADFLSQVFINEIELNNLISLLENKKNLILKGAPGVGKTFIAKRLAYVMMGEKDDTRIHIVQFHQSYSYEDFIEGFRPKADGEGFELKRGPFVAFAEKAARDPERDYYFIIDEINRGNMSKIFGELMMLIETDKRGEHINLLYSNEKFSVPSNLYIIGMMNTADRSLALLDYALRRRFSFKEISPAFDNPTFRSYINELNDPLIINKVIGEVQELNLRIIDELGTGFQIGHSYFVGTPYKVDSLKRIKEVVEYEIIPQLYEYWFDDEQKAEDWAVQLRGCYSGEK